MEACEHPHIIRNAAWNHSLPYKMFKLTKTLFNNLKTDVSTIDNG